MRQQLWLPSLFVAAIAIGGCKKNPLNHLSTDETRVYVTNFDSSAKFNSYKTFSVADSVSVIQDNQLLGQELTNYDTTLIGSIKSIMQQRGYTLVGKSNNPDLAINISKIINTTTNIIDYSTYWDGYAGYYDPYYWGYPDYGYYSPYMMGVYTSQSKGLEIDMLDLKNATANGNKIVSLWSGLAMGEAVFDPVNAKTEANYLFNQSDYIKTN